MPEGFENLQLNDCNKSQLYVSLKVWAYFKAYQAIVADSFMKLQLLKNKQPITLMNKDGVIDLLKTTSPDYEKIIDKKGFSAIPEIMTSLSAKILETIRHDLRDDKDDHQNIEKTNKIITKAQDLQLKTKESFLGSTPPE